MTPLFTMQGCREEDTVHALESIGARAMILELILALSILASQTVRP